MIMEINIAINVLCWEEAGGEDLEIENWQLTILDIIRSIDEHMQLSQYDYTEPAVFSSSLSKHLLKL